MTTPKDSNMNELNCGQFTDCQNQIEAAMAELRTTLDNAARMTDATPEEQRESLDVEICLASRSAYFDFYTWVVLNSAIDRPAEAELGQLFERALAVMHAGKFKDSVQSRFDEFKKQCARVRAGEREPASSF